MTDNEMRMRIAELCGWTAPKDYTSGEYGWRRPDGTHTKCPDYLSDLNAMHEAEKTLNADMRSYHEWLSQITCSSGFKMLHATARQRAEAFLRTKGAWVD